MHLFKVGDRVKAQVHGEMLVGTVCDAREPISIGICFDHYDSTLHNCANTCEQGHGWYISPRDIKLIKPAVVLTKQELICKKVKDLQKKFEERNKVYDF